MTHMIDGESEEHRKLWYSYLYWAREQAISSGAIAIGEAIIDDQSIRLPQDLSNSIKIIIFSAFALEYRMKRVLISFGAKLGEKETLGKIYGQFWPRLKDKNRADNTGLCRKPPSWKSIRGSLDKLVELRKIIAHAKYSELANYLRNRDDHLQTAYHYYNTVVDAIRLINQGIGHDTRSEDMLVKYFEPLKVQSKDI